MTTRHPNDEITRTVLRLRDNTAARIGLRRGASTATEHYAYPWLSHYWTADRSRWLKRPLLRFAALVCTATEVHDTDGEPLGRHLRRNGLTDDRIDAIGRRLVWVQTGDVDKFHQAMRSLIGRSRNHALTWQSAWDFYRKWDHPNPDARLKTRRRLLEQFYRPIPKPRDPATDSSEPAAISPTTEERS